MSAKRSCGESRAATSPPSRIASASSRRTTPVRSGAHEPTSPLAHVRVHDPARRRGSHARRLCRRRSRSHAQRVAWDPGRGDARGRGGRGRERGRCGLYTGARVGHADAAAAPTPPTPGAVGEAHRGSRRTRGRGDHAVVDLPAGVTAVAATFVAGESSVDLAIRAADDAAFGDPTTFKVRVTVAGETVETTGKVVIAGTPGSPPDSSFSASSEPRS